MGEIEEEHEDEKTIWNEEKSALMSQLSTVQAELDEIKEIIKWQMKLILCPQLINSPNQMMRQMMQ